MNNQSEPSFPHPVPGGSDPLNWGTSTIYFEETARDFHADLRELGVPEAVALARSSRRKAQVPSNKTHTHANLEICTLISGIRVNTAGGETWHLHEGDLWVNKPGITHGSGIAPSGPSTIYYLEIRPPVPGETFLGLTPEEGQAFWQRWLDLPTGFCPISPLCKELFAALINLVGKPVAPAHLRSTTYTLLFFLLTLLEDSPRRTIHPGIQKACDLINATPAEDLPDLETLARQIDLSLTYFKATFKHDIGVPPAKYIQNRRLSTIASLLIHTEMTPAEIAKRFGFSTAHYFCTVFQTYTGQTPQDYRATHRSA